jgi:hypothetical protein
MRHVMILVLEDATQPVQESMLTTLALEEVQLLPQLAIVTLVSLGMAFSAILFVEIQG